VTIHLIRHAAAGSRGSFAGHDLDRPLSKKGRAQAEALAGCFAEIDVRAVMSSTALRCVQTVTPMADACGLDVKITQLLTEGSTVQGLLDLLAAEAGNEGDLVLCSHGDLIPGALSRLLNDGMTVSGPRGCAKGSVWSLAVRDGRIVSASYLPDPRFCAADPASVLNGFAG